MRKLIVANWKENPRTEAGASKLFKEISGKIGGAKSNVETVICPPFVYLEEISREFHKIKKVKSKLNLALGAQDAFWEEQGAFTSEVGPKMLRSLGLQYVIVGHSERRKYLKETDAMINKKIKLVLKDSLEVILCIGEPFAVRKKGIEAAQSFVKKQLKEDLAGIFTGGKGVREFKSLTIAYEPIWAIGSGRNDKPEDAVEMAQFIKREVKGCRFLYGGSVNSKNIGDYVQYREIDGALVGGASLKAAEFIKIIGKIN